MKQSILDLGWNPEIPFNRKNRLKASERVSKILDDTIPKDVFISLNNIIDPGEDIMEEQADRRTHKPILLIFTQGKTPIISQGIKFVTKSSYSHASISFDPELNEVYSYNMRGENFGFIRENLSSFQDNVISVMAFFAPNNIVQTLKNKIKDFQENKTTFDLRIFFNKILHIDHKVSNNEYKQVCSTFVDTVLKSGGINLVGDTEIPDPGQLYNGAKTMPNKIIEVFQDIATKYDGKRVKRKLNLLYDQGTLAINESSVYYNDNNILEEDNNMLFENLSDIRNGVNPYSNKTFFHVSFEEDMDEKILTPRIPSWIKKKIDEYGDKFINELEKTKKETGVYDGTSYEEYKTPRVCFSNSIDGALNAIIDNNERHALAGKVIYVYVPEKPISEYKHKMNKNIIKDKDVFDANITNEMWILEPVKVKFYGTIVIDKVIESRIKRKQVTNKNMTILKYNYKWHWFYKRNKKDLEKESINESTHSYYRITYNGVGIYEQLKKEMYKINYNSSEWNKFKQSKACNWLPLPPSYCDGYYSYFTKLGYDKFMKNTYPIIIEYLDKNNIDIEQCHIDKDSIIYQDKYQIVIDSSNKNKPVNESMIIKKDDVYIDFDKFESGESNILLITGISGSGKSTLAIELSKKYKAEYVQLDQFEFVILGNNPNRDLTFTKKLIDNFFSDNKDIDEVRRNGELKSGTSKMGEVMFRVIEYVLDYARRYKDIRIIIEGVQIYDYCEYNKPLNYPMVIKNTPVLTSFIRKVRRDNWSIKDIVKEAPNHIKWLFKGDKILNNIKKSRLVNESTSILNEACKDIKSAREFVSKVGELAKKYDANYFIVTDGASGIHNNGNPAVRNAREKHIEWERKNNFDPDEDWSKPTNESTSIPNEVKKFPVEFDDEGNLINEDVQSLNSSESNDIYHNIDLWESGKSNVIWITGMSGSGKSTIAKEIADEYNAEYVELDNLLRAKIRNSDTIDNGLIGSYIKSVGGLYNVFPYCSNLDKVGWKDIVKEEEKYYKECDRFFDYIIKYANDHKNKKFVIEGVQISDNCIINDKFMQYVKESPIILKMNGPIKTAYRREKRAIGIGKEKGDNFIGIFKHVATDIHNLMKGKFYIDNYNDLKSIKKYIGESVLNEVKKFPVEFDDEGNLIIYKTRTNSLSYGDEIHDSVQLLESYRNTNNQEGMKYELAKLWFIIDDIEKKMKKRNSSKIDYETLTNNRSTAINVFKTNLEYLMKLDKDFNFAHYYNSTPFSDNGIKVTGSTLKYSLKALRDIIIR